MHAESVIGALGLIIAVAAIYFPLRRQIRNERIAAEKAAKEEQLKAIDKAVAAATSPLVDKIHDLTSERDYLRERNDDLLDQLNKKA